MVDSESQPNQSPSGGRGSGGVFIGRQREMAELTAALDDALPGQGRLAMLKPAPLKNSLYMPRLAAPRFSGGGATRTKARRPIGPGFRPFAPTFSNATPGSFSRS